MIDNIKPKDVVFGEEEFPTVPKTDIIVEKTPDFYKGKSFR